MEKHFESKAKSCRPRRKTSEVERTCKESACEPSLNHRLLLKKIKQAHLGNVAMWMSDITSDVMTLAELKSSLGKWCKSEFGEGRVFIITKAYRQRKFIFNSLANRSYQALVLVSPLDGTQCQNSTDECKFFSGQLTLVCP